MGAADRCRGRGRKDDAARCRLNDGGAADASAQDSDPQGVAGLGAQDGNDVRGLPGPQDDLSAALDFLVLEED